MEGIIHPDFKLSSEAQFTNPKKYGARIKADMYQIKRPEINPCVYGPLIFKNGAKETHVERVLLSSTNVGKSTHLHAKE